ncbi:hypothetical protein ANRL2_03198 [Anaerolineae bacterium]|nr:hypothetical protein ANRL2_03198 [Anaerolineae bacterium]
MIKLTISLITRLHDRWIHSLAHAAFDAWFRANICAPDPAQVTVISFSSPGRWLD